MKSLNILLLSLILSFLTCFPVSAVPGLAQADSAYVDGRYEDALTLYSEVAEKEGVSPELLYNMGNAAYNAGDYGKAVLAYERASRLDPGNKEIKNNLQFLRNKVEDANRAELKGKRAVVSPDDASFFRSVYALIAERSSSNMWASWAAVCFILALGCVALYVFTSGVLLRKIGFFGSVSLIALSVVFVLFSFMAASRVEAADSAVVTAYKVPLLSRPDEGAKVSSAPLTRGSKVEILETEMSDDGSPLWLKVRLNHDYVGWIKASEAEVI